jgi:DNA repair photolyase
VPRGNVARMRWDGQKDGAKDGVLPGLARLSSSVRTVRPPEFAGMTFHEILAKTALNRVPDESTRLPGQWTINPYRGCSHGCTFCYARTTHRYLDLNTGEDFDNQVVVKTNLVEVLRRELATSRRRPARVSLGTSTDPYQRAEGRYALMPGVIKALADFQVPFSILTKGTLIRRDLEALVRAHERADVTLGITVATADERLRASVEPGAPATAARLATIRAIRAAGLDCTVFVAPLLPYLSDDREQLDRLVTLLVEAGATSVLFTPLYLRSAVKPWFMQWLAGAYPELVGRYRTLFRDGQHLPDDYRREVMGRMRAALVAHGLADGRSATAARFGLTREVPRQVAEEQPSLF